jgi:RNA polymerase sigma-70 factor (ECF subfamily)
VRVALAIIDGKVGVVVAPRGRLSMALEFDVRGGKIATISVVADPARLRRLDIGLLD